MNERGGSQGRKRRCGEKKERKNQPGQGDSEQGHKREGGGAKEDEELREGALQKPWRQRDRYEQRSGDSR
jgi:hypothetical protein